MTNVWEFLERLPKMSLSTTIYNNVLQSSGFSDEERLVREAIQNSVDAHRKDADNPVSIRFDKKLLSGAEKASLTKALELKGEPKDRLDLFDLPSGNALSSIDDPEDPLPVLIVSDYHTHGLTGRWDRDGEGDHFGRLVVNLGIDDKAEGSEISGGSFGFGKTVYGKASRIGIVAYYSVFQPSDRTEGCHARFMATGLFKIHKYQDSEYTGFAFYGTSNPDNSAEAIPIVDENAHKVAELCGLKRRSPNEHGTTILILDCDIDVDQLRVAAEKYWWPRLIRNELDVVFCEDEEIFPRPKKNPDIQAYISAYQNFVSDKADPPKSQLRVFNKMSTEDGMKRLGTLSSMVLDADTPLANSVALVRQPGMVVAYRESGSDSYSDCVGVFHSHPDIEKILTYSEPQMHNEWDPNQDRLKKIFSDDGVSVVNAVVRRIDSWFRDFQKSQEPPIPPGGLQARELSKILGRIFDVKGKDPTEVGEAPRRPISIHVNEDRVQGDDELVHDQAEIGIELKDDFEGDELECTINAYHEILGDSSHRIVTRSACELIQDGKVLAQGIPASAPITIKRDVPVKLVARAVSDPVFLARVKVTVEESS